MSFASQNWRAKAAQYFSGKIPTYATTLVGILLRAYGAEALNWDPLTIRSQIKTDFGVEPSRRAYEKMMALVNAMTTDTVYRSVPVFDRTVNAMVDTPANEMDEVPGADDVAWTIVELLMADPEPPLIPGSKHPWSGDIARYVGVVLDNEGISGEPKGLEWALREDQPIAQSLSDDPTMHAGAIKAASSGVDEINHIIQKRVGLLLEHLQDLGIEPAPISS